MVGRRPCFYARSAKATRGPAAQGRNFLFGTRHLFLSARNARLGNVAGYYQSSLAGLDFRWRSLFREPAMIEALTLGMGLTRKRNIGARDLCRAYGARLHLCGGAWVRDGTSGSYAEISGSLDA